MLTIQVRFLNLVFIYIVISVLLTGSSISIVYFVPFSEDYDILPYSCFVALSATLLYVLVYISCWRASFSSPVNNALQLLRASTPSQEAQLFHSCSVISVFNFSLLMFKNHFHLC